MKSGERENMASVIFMFEVWCKKKGKHLALKVHHQVCYILCSVLVCMLDCT